MKTTYDLPEPLVREVQNLARSQGLTARSVVERALVRLLKEHKTSAEFRLPDASIKGDGRTPEFATAGWETVRDAIYGLDRTS